MNKKALYFVSGNLIRVYRRQSTQVRFGRESTNHVIHDGAYMKAAPFRPKRNACLTPDVGHISATQPAAIKLRCESGASSSSSHFAVMEVRPAFYHRHVKKSSDGASIVLGPQPDTEEEGSALDFPEVRCQGTFSKCSNW